MGVSSLIRIEVISGVRVRGSEGDGVGENVWVRRETSALVISTTEEVGGTKNDVTGSEGDTVLGEKVKTNDGSLKAVKIDLLSVIRGVGVTVGDCTVKTGAEVGSGTLEKKLEDCSRLGVGVTCTTGVDGEKTTADDGDTDGSCVNETETSKRLDGSTSIVVLATDTDTGVDRNGESVVDKLNGVAGLTEGLTVVEKLENTEVGSGMRMDSLLDTTKKMLLLVG